MCAKTSVYHLRQIQLSATNAKFMWCNLRKIFGPKNVSKIVAIIYAKLNLVSLMLNVFGIINAENVCQKCVPKLVSIIYAKFN